MTAALIPLWEKRPNEAPSPFRRKLTNGIPLGSGGHFKLSQSGTDLEVSNFAQRLSFKLFHVDCVAVSTFGTC